MFGSHLNFGRGVTYGFVGCHWCSSEFYRIVGFGALVSKSRYEGVGENPMRKCRVFLVMSYGL